MTQRTFTTLVGTLVRMDGGWTRRHLGALLAAGALSTAGLTACTGDDPPPPSSTTNSGPATTSPSAATTATPPAAPKAEPTAKSAEAFVKYFWEVHNYSYATLDPEIFTSLAETECTFCSSTAKDIKDLRQTGARIEGSLIRLFVAAAPPAKITTGIIVTAVISQDPGRVIHGDGSIRKVPAMTKRQAYVSLNWTGHSWLVDDVAIDKSGKAS